MRHAKSAYPPGVADHDRPLAPRGVRQAALAGDWLRAHAPDVDAVLCSTATRTRETLAHTKIKAPVHYDERLYGASPGTVIEEINATEDPIRTLLLIGHEPTLTELVLRLCGADGTDPLADGTNPQADGTNPQADGTNPQAVEAISMKFPTSAIAVLHTAQPWRRLELGTAALVEFHVPR